MRERPPADPWKVETIRWQPPSPIPLGNLTSRYGKPGRDYSDEEFRRIVEWPKRGVIGYVFDDKVTLVIYRFTAADFFCADRWRNGEECDPVNLSGSPKPGGAKPPAKPR